MPGLTAASISESPLQNVQPVQVAPVGETLLRQSGKLDRARPQRHQAHSDRLQSAR